VAGGNGTLNGAGFSFAWMYNLNGSGLVNRMRGNGTMPALRANVSPLPDPQGCSVARLPVPSQRVF
jgi:hypothetical protein